MAKITTANLGSIFQAQYFSRPADECWSDIDDFCNDLQSRRENSSQYLGTVKELRFEEEGDDIWVYGAGPHPVTMTNAAAQQICNQLGFSHAGGLTRISPKLGAAALTERLKYVAEDALCKVLINNTTQKLRAINGPEYGRVWDSEFAFAAKHAIEESDGEFDLPPTWSGERRGLFSGDQDCVILLTSGGSLVDGGTERDQYYRALAFFNSETGFGVGGWVEIFYRIVCGNLGMMGGNIRTEHRFRHTKNAPLKWQNEVLPALTSTIGNSNGDKLIEMITKARDLVLPMEQPKILSLVKDKARGKLTDQETKKAIEYAHREEGQCLSLNDLYNGYTAQARDFPYMADTLDLSRRASDFVARMVA